MTSEDELIRRAQAGDLEAFCRLARGYERRVYTLARHYCRRPEDAEDLSQEVWLKAFRSLGGFRFQSGFYTWLRQITVNTFLNHMRSMTTTERGEATRVRFDSLEDLAVEPARGPLSGGGAGEEELHTRIMAGRVLDALGGLTAQQRLIFLLKHREGMTCREIADALGCSAGTVKKTLFRALLKLRSSLGVAAEAEDVASLAAD